MENRWHAAALLLERGADLLRRRGVLGTAARIALRPLNRLAGLELDLLLAGEIAPVRSHLAVHSRPLPDEVVCRCATDPREFPALRIAVDRLNPGNTFQFPEGDFRVAVLEFCSLDRKKDGNRRPRSEEPAVLLGYWGFLRDGAELKGMGLFVNPDWRGKRLACHLLAVALDAGTEGIRTVTDWTDLFNRASLSAMRRCGLKAVAARLAVTLPPARRLCLRIPLPV